MFDISFTEILVIAVVALVVIGPERLPKVARTLGHLFGRAQRYVNDVKSDIQREMELEELKEWKASIEGTVRSIENSVQKKISQVQDVMEVETELKPSTTASASSPEAVAETAPVSASSSTSVDSATPSAKTESSHEASGAQTHRD